VFVGVESGKACRVYARAGVLVEYCLRPCTPNYSVFENQDSKRSVSAKPVGV